MAFIADVIRLNDDYFRCRGGKLGKRSHRLVEELVYSSMVGAWLTAEERQEIEKRIVARFGSLAVCRTAWHVDEKTGRCDLHVLISAKNMDYPPSLTLWANFGGRDRDHIYATMDSLDVEITRFLNRRPERQKTIKSAKLRHMEATVEVIGRRVPLADELAWYFYKIEKPAKIDEDAITAAIKALRHKVLKVPGRSVSVVFRGRKEPRRYNLADLMDEAVVALERLIDQRRMV